MRQSRERGTCCKLENLVIVRSAITENLFWALCGDVAGTDSLSLSLQWWLLNLSILSRSENSDSPKEEAYPSAFDFILTSTAAFPTPWCSYSAALWICLPFAEILLPLWRSSQERPPTLRKQMSALTWLSLTAPKPSLLLEEGAAVFVFSKLSSPEETKFSSCLSDLCGGEWNSV